MLLPSIVGAVVPDSPIRGTLVLTSRRPRGTPSKPCFCFSSPPPIHAPCNALSLTFSCCTGHTTYSPEGGVHNTCRGSSESTIHLYLLEGPAVSLLPMPLFTSNQALPFGGSEPCHLFPSLDFSSIGTSTSFKPSHQPSAMAAPRASSYICHAAK